MYFQLTDSLGLGMNPQFSPDGQRILFLQSRVPKEDYDSYKQHLKQVINVILQ